MYWTPSGSVANAHTSCGPNEAAAYTIAVRRGSWPAVQLLPFQCSTWLCLLVESNTYASSGNPRHGFAAARRGERSGPTANHRACGPDVRGRAGLALPTTSDRRDQAADQAPPHHTNGRRGLSDVPIPIRDWRHRVDVMVPLLVTGCPADVTMADAMATASHMTPGSMHVSSVSAPSLAPPRSRLAAEFQAAFIYEHHSSDAPRCRVTACRRRPARLRHRRGLAASASEIFPS